MKAGSAQATGECPATKEPHAGGGSRPWPIRSAVLDFWLLGLAPLMLGVLHPGHAVSGQDHPVRDSSVRLSIDFVHAEPDGVAAEPEWRRTAQGWERRENWILLAPPRPVCHPGLLAAFQALVSVFALVAWPVRPLALSFP